MTLRFARAALFTMIPLELLLVILLASGVSLPAPALVAAETAVLLAVGLEVVTAYRLFRAERRDGASRRAALSATIERLVPTQVRRIIGFEVKGLISLLLWVTRRRDGVPPGATAVPYAREQAPTLLALLFVMVVETVGVDLLMRALDVPHGLRAVVLFVDVYGVLLGLAIGAAYVTRPHVVTPGELRIRHGAYFDLRVPRELIASVRLSKKYDADKMVSIEDGRLSLAVSSQTNVIVELTQPITVVRPLGGLAEATTIRFFADTPGAALTALRSDTHREPLTDTPAR